MEQHVRPPRVGRIAVVAVVLAVVGLGSLAAAGLGLELGQADFRSLLDQRRHAPQREKPGPNEFYFTRGVYSSWGRWNSWAIDFPKADVQFLAAVNTLVDMDAATHENAVRLDDPNLRRYPFLYMLEIAGMSLTPAEVKGLRDYLLAGGFLVVDDFWGEYAFANLSQQLRLVLPEYQIVDVPMDHPIFNAVYRIDEVIQVPAIGNWWGGVTSECYGCEVFARGIFDDQGRLMVFINGNTDLGDAWEWFERPEYPLQYSSFAVQMGVNFIVYSMTH